MAIWHKKHELEEFSNMRKDTILETIGLEITELRENSIHGRIPVDKRTVQPAKILHGGASVVLAETLGSLGSSLIIDPAKYFCVGLEINANHVRPVTNGYVYGSATPIHIGRTTHIWSIEIRNEENKLVCISRITMAIKEK